MKKNILYTLALLSIFASCAKTELPHFGGENDPNAVTISPSVALVSTRSNPLGDADAQEKFNPGDVITITDKADNEVYTYKLESDGKWKPTDGKYLLWHDETLNISASYGESNITNVTDQSTAAGIAAADYMTFIGSVKREPGSNELSFNMDRRRYLVIVIIESYGDQYNRETDKVSGLKLSFEESGSSVEINPYVRDVSGNNVTTEGAAGTEGTEGTLGYSYSAICDVEYKTIKISYQVAGDKREAILSGFGGPDPGYSYTIKLRVGKNKIEAGDVTVNGWTDADAWDDVTATKIPYLTFSAESEQKFNMTFESRFTLGTNEYFEYSVGDGNWTSFTGTVENIAFGGANGDLRLRGKSSNGTATDNTKYSKIKFSTADVMVKCTGDIRTLID
ncbi:MAG: fimbrillin family protein, partial [Candidatus Cryptobacteroides sp.]